MSVQPACCGSGSILFQNPKPRSCSKEVKYFFSTQTLGFFRFTFFRHLFSLLKEFFYLTFHMCPKFSYRGKNSDPDILNKSIFL